jgi:hypothetical protein
MGLPQTRSFRKPMIFSAWLLIKMMHSCASVAMPPLLVKLKMCLKLIDVSMNTSFTGEQRHRRV